MIAKILKCIEDVDNVNSYYYDTQKIQIIYDFLLKSHYYDAQKKYLLPKQHHITKIPKKYWIIL